MFIASVKGAEENQRLHRTQHALLEASAEWRYQGKCVDLRE
jgi:hypothetical protein